MRKFANFIGGFFYIPIAFIFFWFIGLDVLYQFGKFTCQFFYKKIKGIENEEDEEDD